MAEFDEKTVKRAKHCLGKCTMCKAARKKPGGIVTRMLKFEAKLCPWCRAYTKVYGVPAWENPPGK